MPARRLLGFYGNTPTAGAELLLNRCEPRPKNLKPGTFTPDQTHFGAPQQLGKRVTIDLRRSKRECSRVNIENPGPGKGMFKREHRESGGLVGYVHVLNPGIRLGNRAPLLLNGKPGQTEKAMAVCNAAPHREDERAFVTSQSATLTR